MSRSKNQPPSCHHLLVAVVVHSPLHRLLLNPSILKTIQTIPLSGRRGLTDCARNWTRPSRRGTRRTTAPRMDHRRRLAR